MYFRPNSAAPDSGLSLPRCQSVVKQSAGLEAAFNGRTKQSDPRETVVRKSRVASPRDSHISTGSSIPIPLDAQNLHIEIPKPKAIRALRSTHNRSRSAVSSNSPAPSIVSDYPRVRSVSVLSRPLGPKPSYISPAALPWGILPRVEPTPSVVVQPEDTIGSFSPTSCPRQHIHKLLNSFSLPRIQKPSLTVTTRLREPADTSSHDPGLTTPPSPLLSPIPSICRTPSSYSESEYLPTAPSSAGPATPVHSAVSSPQIQNKLLRPILEALEDASKFRVRTACAACGKQGSNYPCCPRCGEMWCSRACRLQSNGGKRHICGGR